MWMLHNLGGFNCFCGGIMVLRDYQRKIIELYLEQELLIASLYALFAGKCPLHKDFWDSMVSEEREHAAWIQHFLDGIEQNKVYFSEGKTRSYTLNTSIAYIKRIIMEFDNKPFDSTKALIIAHDLERSLLEKNVFKCFDGDSPEVMRILEILKGEQDHHIEKVGQFVLDARESSRRSGVR